MRHYLALSLLVGAFAVALMAVFGDDSYSRLQALNKGIQSQQQKNSELESKVSKLQTEIAALRFDDRELERIARNDLGLARPNELIFRFNSSLDEEVKKLNKAKVISEESANNTKSALRIQDPKNSADSARQVINSKPATKSKQ